MTPADEVLYGGALGGGKSYLARVASIVFSVEIPGLITYLFRRTFKEVLANHVHTPGGYLEMLGPLLKSGEVNYSKSDNSFSFWNGSRIQLAHSQYESDIFVHQGAQIGFLIIDEATSFTPDMIRYIRSRVRLGSLKVPDKYKGLFPRILYTANPGGVGHSYFKSGFVNHGAGHVFKAPDEDGGMKRQYIPAKLTDNKVLMQNDPNYASRVKGMGKPETVQAMLDGDWNVVSGGIFSDVWEPSRHVVKPFPIPPTWDIDRGYDYGSSAPAAYLLFAESDGEEHINPKTRRTIYYPRGHIVIMGEIYFADKNFRGLRLSPRTQAARMYRYEIENGYKNLVHPGPADNAIFSKEPGQDSSAAQMALEHINFIRSDKSAGSRVLGASLMRQKLINSLQVPVEEPGITIFDTCYHTIRTVPTLGRDEDNTEDADSEGEDHIWDVIRYRILKNRASARELKVVGS